LTTGSTNWHATGTQTDFAVEAVAADCHVASED